MEGWNVGMMVKENSKEPFLLIYALYPLFQSSSIPVFQFSFPMTILLLEIHQWS